MMMALALQALVRTPPCEAALQGGPPEIAFCSLLAAMQGRAHTPSCWRRFGCAACPPCCLLIRHYRPPRAPHGSTCMPAAPPTIFVCAPCQWPLGLQPCTQPMHACSPRISHLAPALSLLVALAAVARLTTALWLALVKGGRGCSRARRGGGGPLLSACACVRAFTCYASHTHTRPHLQVLQQQSMGMARG